MAETHECPNCGATISVDEPTCKYCGGQNPSYVKPVFSSFAPPIPGNASSTDHAKSSRVNWVLFVILLIICWPAAIIYLIVMSSK